MPEAPKTEDTKDRAAPPVQDNPDGEDLERPARRTLTTHMFYVFLMSRTMQDDKHNDLLNLVQLSPPFGETAKAKSWLRKNFHDLLQKYGNAARYCIAAVQPPIEIKTETKVKLGL